MVGELGEVAVREKQGLWALVECAIGSAYPVVGEVLEGVGGGFEQGSHRAHLKCASKVLDV